MALRSRRERFYSAQEYLAFDDRSERRNEYDGGTVTAMAGGSVSHAAIISNLVQSIGNRLGAECRVFSSDLRVHVAEFDKFYYPDVLVVCGPPKLYESRDDTVTNPVLIVEVLSKKTEARDRGEKMLTYRGLGSLCEYVLVSQTNPIVEQYILKAAGVWVHKATIGLKSRVRFESIDAELSLEEIFQRIEFRKKSL